jgi:hypothetical protein
MTKELIILTLIVLAIYLYYQQNQQPHLYFAKKEYDNVIHDLKRQVQHYQTLYQKRINQDLEAQELASLREQKITDLGQQLINLAKRKIKGQKEAEKLVQQLEENGNKDKIN